MKYYPKYIDRTLGPKKEERASVEGGRKRKQFKKMKAVLAKDGKDGEEND